MSVPELQLVCGSVAFPWCAAVLASPVYAAHALQVDASAADALLHWRLLSSTRSSARVYVAPLLWSSTEDGYVDSSCCRVCTHAGGVAASVPLVEFEHAPTRL